MYTYKAHCIGVVDGDTIDVLIDLGFKNYTAQRLRLLGIDTPELNAIDLVQRNRALRAKERLKEMLRPTSAIISPGMPLTWDLTVYSYKADSFGRYLAQVLALNEAGEQYDVGNKLLSEGLADPAVHGLVVK